LENKIAKYFMKPKQNKPGAKQNEKQNRSVELSRLIMKKNYNLLGTIYTHEKKYLHIF